MKIILRNKTIDPTHNTSSPLRIAVVNGHTDIVRLSKTLSPFSEFHDAALKTFRSDSRIGSFEMLEHVIADVQHVTQRFLELTQGPKGEVRNTLASGVQGIAKAGWVDAGEVRDDELGPDGDDKSDSDGDDEPQSDEDS